jgi:hypothetical protein
MLWVTRRLRSSLGGSLLVGSGVTALRANFRTKQSFFLILVSIRPESDTGDGVAENLLPDQARAVRPHQVNVL